MMSDLPENMLEAIAIAVEKDGGDLNDAADLAAQWERLAAGKYGRVDAMRRENLEREAAYEAVQVGAP